MHFYQTFLEMTYLPPCYISQDSQKEEVSELKVKVTSLEDELDDLRKEVKDKHEEMTQLRSDGETKEMTIQDLQAVIETYQQKQEVRSG